MKTVVRRCLILVMCLSMCVSHISAAFVTGGGKTHNSVTEDTGGDEPIIYEEGADEETGISDEAVYGESAVFEDGVYGETQITGESETGESSVSDEGTYGETQVFEEETDKGSGMPEGSEAEQSVVSEEEAADESGFSGEEVSEEAEMPEGVTAGESDTTEAGMPEGVTVRESDTTVVEMPEEVVTGESDPTEAETSEEVTAEESEATEAEMSGDAGIPEEASGLVDEAEAGTGIQEGSAYGVEVIQDEENSETEGTQNASSEIRQYGDDVVVGFEDLGDYAVISLDNKIALFELERQFPAQLGLRFGGTVHYQKSEDGTLIPIEAEGYHTQYVEVGWKCAEDYNDSLEYFHFVPILEEYSMAEALVLPEITVSIEGIPEIPHLVEREPATYDEYEVPVIDTGSSGGMRKRRGVIPAQYDAFEEGRLPKVRKQSPYGTCFAHGTIGALETDLISDGNADTNIDLSELHLAYFLFHDYYDEKNCNYGDIVRGSDGYLDNGGDEKYACNVLANMVGPALEADVPYSQAASYAPDPSDGRGMNAAQLTGAYQLRCKGDDTDEDKKAKDAVKNAILTHGGVIASFHALDVYPNDYYDDTYGSYYDPSKDKTNHTVMLVGWNDNFSSLNFKSGRPEGDGAWLVRNSWGDDHYSYFGYFWISYYDKSLSDIVYSLDAQPWAYDHCYAYNSIPINSSYWTKMGSISGTQVFHVDEKEEIKAVGIQTLNGPLDVEVTVSCEGNTVTTQTVTNSPGYYLIALDESLKVRESSDVTVTVGYSGEGDSEGKLYYPVEYQFDEGEDSLICWGTEYIPNCASGGLILTISGNDYNVGADGCIRLFTMDYTPSPQDEKTDISTFEATLSEQSYVYDGSARTPAVTVKDGNVVLVEGTDYTVSMTDNVQAGTATVTIQGIGQYTGTIITHFDITKAPVELQFEKDTVYKLKTDSPFSNPLTNISGSPVEYSSSNESVASVDQNTGIITVKNTGEAVITASAAETDNYQAGSADFRLIVSTGSRSDITWTLSNGKLTITGIGDMEDADEPFSWDPDAVTSITIGYGILSIPDHVFAGSANLTEVYISDTVSRIGEHSFDNCPNVYFTCNGDTYARYYADQHGISGCDPAPAVDPVYYDYDSWESIISGGSDGADDSDAPKGRMDVTGSFGEDISYILSEDGTLTLTGTGEMESFSLEGPWDDRVKKIVISEGITSIGNYAFSGCGQLTEVMIPDSVIAIGHSAFSRCNNLETITIPTGVILIGEYAFSQTKLSSVYVPDSVRYIGRDAFYGCSELTSVSLSANITCILTSTFGFCSKLSSIDIPDGVVVLGGFMDCTGLTTAAIPDSVKRISSYAFKNCKSLTDTGLPETVTSIGSDAFYCCESLTSVRIPAGVEIINDSAFYSCSSLAELFVPATVTEIGFAAFLGCSQQLIIYGESGSYAEQYAHEKGYAFRSVSTAADISDCTIRLSSTGYTYDGKEKKPTVTVTNGAVDLIPDTDYTVSYTNNINAGTASVTIEGKGDYSGSETVTFSIAKAKPALSFASGSVSKKTTDSSFTNKLTKNTDGIPAYSSANTAVASVNASTGAVTIKGAGTAVITVKTAASQNYQAGSASYTLTVSAVNISGLTITLSPTSFTYDGKAKQPAVTVKNGSVTLVKNTDYTVTYSNNTNATSDKTQATAKISGKGKYKGSKNVTFKINKAAQSITAKASSSTVAVGKTATVTITGARGTKSYKSSDTTIATVTSAGEVKAKKVGKVQITASSAAAANYNAASKKITIKVVPAATASLTAANQATGIRLSWSKVTGATGYLVYRGSTRIATIKSGSTVTYTDKKANSNGTKYTFKIIPTASTGNGTAKSLTTYMVSRPAVSSAANSASKKMTVKWGKNAKGTGYQIQYSTSKTFASGNKSVNITSASTVSRVIGSLTKGKTYYVRIRTYRTVGSKNYWSAWSAAKNVKISK